MKLILTGGYCQVKVKKYNKIIMRLGFDLHITGEWKAVFTGKRHDFTYFASWFL